MTERFGTAPDGADVLLAEIANGGARARVMSWGASLQDFRMEGVPHALVLGSPVFDPYPGPMRHFGAVAGPVANRIAGGRALLDGRALDLDRNERGRTTLHGGTRGASVSNWMFEGQEESACRFTLHIPDGTCGFPGPMDLRATYRLDAEGALEVELEGRTARPGLCNLAPHSYWTLDGSGRLDGHVLEIAADAYLPVDGDLIPLGGPAPVAGTRFDFRTPRPITQEGEPVLDHNFCLREGAGMRPACSLSAGGLVLDVSTTEPGLQVYDASGLDTAPHAGQGGRLYGARAGVALEPQRWPDAPNHPGFPPIRLDPGETSRQVSRFHVRKERP